MPNKGSSGKDNPTIKRALIETNARIKINLNLLNNFLSRQYKTPRDIMNSVVSKIYFIISTLCRNLAYFRIIVIYI